MCRLSILIITVILPLAFSEFEQEESHLEPANLPLMEQSGEGSTVKGGPGNTNIVSDPQHLQPSTLTNNIPPIVQTNQNLLLRSSPQPRQLPPNQFAPNQPSPFLAKFENNPSSRIGPNIPPLPYYGQNSAGYATNQQNQCECGQSISTNGNHLHQHEFPPPLPLPIFPTPTDINQYPGEFLPQPLYPDQKGFGPNQDYEAPQFPSPIQNPNTDPIPLPLEPLEQQGSLNLPSRIDLPSTTDPYSLDQSDLYIHDQNMFSPVSLPNTQPLNSYPFMNPCLIYNRAPLPALVSQASPAVPLNVNSDRIPTFPYQIKCDQIPQFTLDSQPQLTQFPLNPYMGPYIPQNYNQLPRYFPYPLPIEVEQVRGILGYPLSPYQENPRPIIIEEECVSCREIPDIDSQPPKISANEFLAPGPIRLPHNQNLNQAQAPPGHFLAPGPNQPPKFVNS